MNARPSKLFYEFDGFRIDVEERCLLRNGRPVGLTAKVFDILFVLVENNGHTVEKDSLMESVWGEIFVEEGNLSRNVSTLRKELGEDGHKYITTVPKRGYRFEGEVTEVLEERGTPITEVRLDQPSAIEPGSTRILPTAVSTRMMVVIVPVVVLLVLGFAWLGTRPSTSENNSLAAERIRRGTDNDEAFELYQKGRELWQNRSVIGLHQATLNFEQAIERDPNFALAHAALADAYAFDVILWKRAEGEANEAIRLDSTLGRPHAAIGFVRMFWEQKLPEAEPYFKRAISLDPSYATAHQWYAINLMARSKGGGALAEMMRALELEPNSLAINADLCQMLYLSRKYGEAIEQCKKTLKMDPGFIPAHDYLYEIYTTSEMYPEAVAEYFTIERLNRTTKVRPDQLEKLQQAYVDGGIGAFWRARIALLNSYVPPDSYSIAKYHARLGETDKAMPWIRRSAQGHDFAFLFFAVEPAFYSLNTDDRVKDLRSILDD